MKRTSKDQGQSLEGTRNQGTVLDEDLDTVRAQRPDSSPSSRTQQDARARIAERAFALYEASGFKDGNDLEHWYEAERQIKTLDV